MRSAFIRRVGGNTRLFLSLAVLVALFSILNPNFFSLNSLYSILMATTVIGLVCIGQTLCIMTGGFDLSVGSIALISGCLGAWAMRSLGASVGVAAAAVLLVGLGAGFVNGIFVVTLRINALITTLATSSILTGLAFLLNKGSYINVRQENFRFLGTYRLFDLKILQLPILLLALAFLVASFVLGRTIYGRRIFAVGGNRKAAVFSGIRANGVGISVYVASGFLAALGGLVLASRMGSAQPSFGSGFALNSIAAVILGGVSLKGGKGSVLGALWGILILQVLAIGLIAIGLEPYYQDIASGLVLLTAVFFDINRKG